MPPKVIVHVADAALSEASGMGRVAVHWRAAFVRRGYAFIHLGPPEITASHPTAFPRRALAAYRALPREPALLLVHEPAAGAFVQESVPTFVFSHGLESRGAAIAPSDAASRAGVEKLRRLVTAPLWRRRTLSCDRGFRHATAALLINQEDAAFAASHHGVTRERRMVFRNGVSTVAGDTSLPTAERCRVLFIGTWERRKGVETLCKAASLLAARRIDVSWHLAGTGVSEEAVRAAWPRELAAATRVTPKFPAAEEAAIFRESSLFVLPSFFEGQPLSLLQAMAWGRCCVVADGCGQRDLIVPRRNGLLHAPGDAEALAALLAECVADSKLRAQLGANARASVHGRTWETVSDEVVSFVEALAGA